MTHQTQDGQTMRLLGAEGNYAVGVMPGHRRNNVQTTNQDMVNRLASCPAYTRHKKRCRVSVCPAFAALAQHCVCHATSILFIIVPLNVCLSHIVII